MMEMTSTLTELCRHAMEQDVWVLTSNTGQKGGQDKLNNNAAIFKCQKLEKAGLSILPSMH
jgi:hypothetical protein